MENTGNYLEFINYAIVMSLQIYLPCYYGNEVTINSNNLTNALYKSNWINMDIQTKKLIYIYMELLKRPVVIKAGNFFYIGLDVFVRIMRTTYSLFALLMNMEH